jgi:hypothetical protein
MARAKSTARSRTERVIPFRHVRLLIQFVDKEMDARAHVDLPEIGMRDLDDPTTLGARLLMDIFRSAFSNICRIKQARNTNALPRADRPQAI